MKTIKLIKNLLIAGFVIVGNVSVFAARPNNDFVYNTEEVGGMKVSETVYKMDKGFLTNYQKYNYKYNDEKQITENILQRWDSEHNQWQNDLCVRYVYKDNSVVVSYYKWDGKKKEFVLVPRMTTVVNN